MYSFKEYLTEGRDAPLYHGTSFYAANNILYRNVMEARGLDHVPNHFLMQEAISFTRNFDFAKRWSEDEIVFEVDQRKLAQAYKIVPKNHWAIGKVSHSYRTMRVARPKPHKDKYGNVVEYEYEEAVLAKKINNFDKYILKIIAVKDFDKVLYTLLATHPKLYSWSEKRFVNQ